MAKNKIIRTVSNTEHVLYEVSAELLTFLENEPLFNQLFRGVERYVDRIIESLSHTRSEGQRAKAAQSLMHDLWRSNMLGGPYPVPSLLPEFEFSRLFYPRHRDHTVHQLRVLLLGLYFYLRNASIRNAVRHGVRSFTHETGELPEDRIDQLFLRAWLLAATYHDQGYVFELDLPKEQREDQLAKLLLRATGHGRASIVGCAPGITRWIGRPVRRPLYSPATPGRNRSPKSGIA
jgi:hypothetical protein